MEQQDARSLPVSMVLEMHTATHAFLVRAT
jgi:hypothetical protein